MVAAVRKPRQTFQDRMSDSAINRSILYIEDDVVVLTAYRDRLQKAGFDVECSVDGVEAMRILAVRCFDLIILDLLLPRFSGTEVLKALRNNPRLKAIPVVVFSSNLESVPESVAGQADRLLLKGNCSFATLLETVRDLLAAPHRNSGVENN